MSINAAQVETEITITGSAKGNLIVGSENNDYINGANGADTLYGGNGSDELYGGPGNDKLYGGKGADSLWGGAGEDTLTGGDGKDVFIYNGGTDTIIDYAPGVDTIMLKSGKILGYQTNSNGDLLYNLSNGQIIVQGGATKSYVAIKNTRGNTFASSIYTS